MIRNLGRLELINDMYSHIKIFNQNAVQTNVEKKHSVDLKWKVEWRIANVPYRSETFVCVLLRLWTNLNTCILSIWSSRMALMDVQVSTTATRVAYTFFLVTGSCSVLFSPFLWMKKCVVINFNLFHFFKWYFSWMKPSVTLGCVRHSKDGICSPLIQTANEWSLGPALWKYWCRHVRLALNLTPFNSTCTRRDIANRWMGDHGIYSELWTFVECKT